MTEGTIIIPTNEFQTPITREFLDTMPSDVQEQFLDFVENVPLIKWMISPDRPRAKDLPRDKFGRVIVDITHPHILENMDFFRPAARFFEENGCYSLLKPNPNPKSEYGKWYTEELRRCLDGYVRESDGEWVTGREYFYLNYSPIMLNRESERTGLLNRVEGLPDFWEGIHYRYAYLEQARFAGEHALELARRGCSKSFGLASLMSHDLILGENLDAQTRRTVVLTAYLREYLADKDGTLSKFVPMIDFAAQNTSFPRLMTKRSPSEMLWTMGYKDANGNITGSRNAVMGLSVKNDEGKVRGKRGVILFEEFGNYPNFKEVWNNVRDSVKEGSRTYSLLYGVGTAGDKASDFAGLRTMLYNPRSFGVHALENVYDLRGKGTKEFSYFFPSYISRAGCMDRDGNSDVVKALREILMERWVVKQSGDAASLLSVTAQMPITPAEAILKVQSKMFPVVTMNERLRQIDENPRFYDDVYVGTLVDVGGKAEFRMTSDAPIRQWPLDNNSDPGALEVYEMPPSGTVPPNRYIIGVDPYDNDQAKSSDSLYSVIVFDLFSDRIVAEYTGRKPYADDNHEMVRLLCMFYNAKAMFEANRKGYYAYFARKHCTWMLADCPEYLRDRQLVKYSMFGSSAKGISVNSPLKNYGVELIRDWMNKLVEMEFTDENGEVSVRQVPNLYFIKGRALLLEAISYDPSDPHQNTDRISALSQVMLYREEFMVLYGGAQPQEDTGPGDDFFEQEYSRYALKKDPARYANEVFDRVFGNGHDTK